MPAPRRAMYYGWPARATPAPLRNGRWAGSQRAPGPPTLRRHELERAQRASADAQDREVHRAGLPARRPSVGARWKTATQGARLDGLRLLRRQAGRRRAGRDQVRLRLQLLRRGV